MKRQFLIGLTMIAICALLFPQVADAGQSRVGRVAFHVLKIDQGARQAGMAGAFVAISDNIDAIFVNPAGISDVENSAYTLSYIRWLIDSRVFSGGFAYKSQLGVWGLSVMSFSTGEYEETTIFQSQGTGRMVSGGDIAIGITFAKKITDRLSFGIKARWIQETLDQDKLSTWDINMGTYFYTGFRSLRIGMTFRNLGPDIKWFPQQAGVSEVSHMPIAFNAALAMEVFGEKDGDAYLTVTAENHFASDYAEPQYRVGGEFWFQNMLALRGGYKFNYDEETFSVGLGVKYPVVEGKDLYADFAYSNFGDVFDPILRFSIGGSF